MELLASGASVSLATETRGDTERDGGGGVGVEGGESGGQTPEPLRRKTKAGGRINVTVTT